MTGHVERRPGGQFAKGQSGNPAGARKRRRKELPSLEDLHRTVLEVAVSPTRMSVGGSVREITYFEANVWGLASGKAANRLTSRDFVEMVKEASRFFENQDADDAFRERVARLNGS